MAYTILIVEDNENNRILFRDILAFHGYGVAEAADGQTALDMVKELKPDLILMDIQMPGMDGITATSILKSDPATSGLRVIALTSFAMNGDKDKFMSLGFDGYLSKPVNTRTLPTLVKGWLSDERNEEASA